MVIGSAGIVNMPMPTTGGRSTNIGTAMSCLPGMLIVTSTVLTRGVVLIASGKYWLQIRPASTMISVATEVTVGKPAIVVPPLVSLVRPPMTPISTGLTLSAVRAVAVAAAPPVPGLPPAGAAVIAITGAFVSGVCIGITAKRSRRSTALVATTPTVWLMMVLVFCGGIGGITVVRVSVGTDQAKVPALGSMVPTVTVSSVVGSVIWPLFSSVLICAYASAIDNPMIVLHRCRCRCRWHRQ